MFCPNEGEKTLYFIGELIPNICEVLYSIILLFSKLEFMKQILLIFVSSLEYFS